MFGAIEAGGTKFVCGVGTGPDDLDTIQFPTTSPDETLANAIKFLREESRGELKAVGIGSFGPIDLHSTSLTFGYITSTPKAGWQNYNLAGTVRDALSVPVGFDTDVDAAALGEARWGAAQNLTDFLYLTVGTGIGGVAGPALFGALIDTGSRDSVFLGYLLGAGLMIAAAAVAWRYAIAAERRTLESVAPPLASVE